MRDYHSNAGDNKFLYFSSIFFLVSSVSSAVVAGYSDANKFLPGFNDNDDSFDMSIVFWLLSAVCFSVSLYSIAKIYLNNRQAEVLQSYASIQVESVGQRTYGTSGNQGVSIVLREPASASGCLKVGWGTLGALSSGMAFLVFLHIARHISERDHKNDFLNSSFANATFSHFLIDSTAGTVAAAVFTGFLMLLYSSTSLMTPSCSKRFLSFCHDSETEDEVHLDSHQQEFSF